MPLTDSLIDTIIETVMTRPAKDSPESLRDDVRRVLDAAGAVVPLPGDQVLTVEGGRVATIPEPGYRAVIVPELADPEVQAMAGCYQLIDQLRLERDHRAVQRALAWLGARLSADEATRTAQHVTSDDRDDL